MLKAISDTTLNIDSDEYPLDAVPDGILTQSDLNQVRSIHPDALADYEVKVEGSDRVLPE